MSEAAPTLFPVAPGEPAFAAGPEPTSDGYVITMAERFVEERPYAVAPYSKRNWGGRLHSLCSYQGKLKPSIAHFLIKWFTKTGAVVLDPMCGVGTIPLEARIQGRIALASDLSDLAVAVSRAKLDAAEPAASMRVLDELADYISGSAATLDDLARQEEAEFGLNGVITDYFHPDTLRELLLARRFFADADHDRPGRACVLTAVLHLLHGNRPYALAPQPPGHATEAHWGVHLPPAHRARGTPAGPDVAGARRASRRGAGCQGRFRRSSVSAGVG